MAEIRMLSVSVKESVRFSGPSDVTLQAKDGEITFDTASRVIIAKPSNPAKETIMIPLENVRMMVPMTPEAAAKVDEKKRGDVERAKQLAEQAAKARMQVARKIPVPEGEQKQGVVKMVKQADGSIKEVLT